MVTQVRRSVAVLLLFLAACGRSQPPPPSDPIDPLPTDALPTTVPATTSTSVGFETPSIVDAPYVQRVVDELFRLEGEAARYLYAKKQPDAEFNARLDAILGEPALATAKTFYGRGAAEGFTNFANPPGNPKAKVQTVLEATPECILVRASIDFRPLFIEADRTDPNGFIQLHLADLLPLNLTGWGIVGAGVPADPKEVPRC